MRKVVYGVLPVMLLLNSGIGLAEEAKVKLKTMEVVGVTPLQGSGIDADKVPAPIQTVTSDQIEEAQSLSLSDYMNRYMGSVHINEAQNNPLQPDVYYRGFVASPLLGLPQGLSVYVNGVRFNEPFGDTVNWDLLPPGAIDSMTLMPGSNPLFGLNTLGGAISVQTKTGFSAPGHEFEAYGGSWDRHSEELSSGWNNGTWGYFVDLRHFDEEGWRDHSPTSAQQVFGTLSWRNERATLDLTLGANDNDMRGNGAVPDELHNLYRKAVFTHPDQTITRMFFSELAGTYDLTDRIQLSGNAFFRQNRIRTFNGDDSDFEECTGANAGFMCNEENELIFDLSKNQIPESDDVEGATQNTSQTHMRTAGGTLQSLFAHDLFGHQNSFVFGASYDYSDTNFESDTELASLTASRGTEGSGIIVGFEDDDGDFNPVRVRLSTYTENYSFFFSDTFSLTDTFDVTFGGRYNHTSVDLKSDLNQDLNGHHNFDRFNPSVGYTWRMLDNVTMYGSYSESSRVPTPMELSCAKEDDPCRLPNSFLADPPLDQVVAKSWEAGFRGDLNKYLQEADFIWNAGFFHTTNHDDIIFRRSGDSPSEGFFTNVGQTQRFGVEAGFSSNVYSLFSEIDDWNFSTNYTYLNARFLDGFLIQDPRDMENPTALNVQRGNRIPGLPEHIYKATLGVTLWKRWSLAIDTQYSGEQYFRGDEANVTTPLGGYWVFNARTEVKVNDHLAFFGKLDNIFDRDYKTFGVYGESDEVLEDMGIDDTRFVSPGAPRAGWVGVRLTY